MSSAELTGPASVTTVVKRITGYIDVFTAHEYAFRTAHTLPASLKVAGQTITDFDEGRVIERQFGQFLAPQTFLNLEAGLQPFELTVLFNGPFDSASVRMDSAALDGWLPVDIALDVVRRVDDFPDLNGNGVDDAFDPDCDADGVPDDVEPDCNANGVPDDCEAPDCDCDGVPDVLEPDTDGDGIPDDCELDCDGNGVPDEFENTLGNAIDLGVVAQPGPDNFFMTTAPSGFNTEIAVWDASGTLIATHDDILPAVPPFTNGILQSLLAMTLPAGDYAAAATGHDTAFGDGFVADPRPGGCSAGGSLALDINGVRIDSRALPAGRVQYYTFSIGTSACNDADLAEPYGVLDLADVSAFIVGFTDGGPVADLDGNGVLDLTDISLFVGAFTGGCP